MSCFSDSMSSREDDGFQITYPQKSNKLQICMLILLGLLVLIQLLIVGAILYLVPNMINLIKIVDSNANDITSDVNNIRSNFDIFKDDADEFINLSNNTMNSFNKEMKQFVDDFQILLDMMVPAIYQFQSCMNKYCPAF